jgi:hypothetical protein
VLDELQLTYTSYNGQNLNSPAVSVIRGSTVLVLSRSQCINTSDVTHFVVFCDHHFVCGTYFLFPSGQVFCVDCLSRPTAVLLSFVVKFGQYNYTRWTHLSPVLSLRLIQVTTFILFQNICIYSYAVGLCCNACHERCNSVSNNSSVVTDILMDRLSLLFEHVVDGVTTMFKICIIRYLLHFPVRFF